MKHGCTADPYGAPPVDSGFRILVACEFSGVVRDAFATLGHDSWSCDLLPSERPGQHVQGDIRQQPMGWIQSFDLIVAHPHTARSFPLTERYIRIANLDKRNTTEDMGL